MMETREAERFAEWFRHNYPGPDTIIGRPDWHAPKIYRAATHELRKQLDEVRAERDALREALVSEREENLWNAYNTGHERDGQWTHCFMSDGEWLASECGLDPRKASYPADEVMAAIPAAARPRRP